VIIKDNVSPEEGPEYYKELSKLKATDIAADDREKCLEQVELVLRLDQPSYRCLERGIRLELERLSSELMSLR
jgi:hypothetical protein